MIKSTEKYLDLPDFNILILIFYFILFLILSDEIATERGSNLNYVCLSVPILARHNCCTKYWMNFHQIWHRRHFTKIRRNISVQGAPLSNQQMAGRVQVKEGVTGNCHPRILIVNKTRGNVTVLTEHGHRIQYWVRQILLTRVHSTHIKR
jgi:hypothetical protein